MAWLSNAWVAPVQLVMNGINQDAQITPDSLADQEFEMLKHANSLAHRTINDEPDFQPINRGYNSVFRPNHLSLGLVVPLETERSARFRASFDYIERMWEDAPAFESSYGSPHGGMDMLPKPTTGRLPLLITGGSQQDPDWARTIFARI